MVRLLRRREEEVKWGTVIQHAGYDLDRLKSQTFPLVEYNLTPLTVIIADVHCEQGVWTTWVL